MADENEMDEELDLLSNPPFPLTAVDRQLLAMKDEDFHRIDWTDLQRIIASNTLEDLKRLPSDLHRYLHWSCRTKKAFGSITNYVLHERLHWTPSHGITTDQPVTATSFNHHSEVPFRDRRDYAVLKNDWPYGFAPGITHLVVWSRTPIAVDEDAGDVTSQSRTLITAFVRQYFIRTLTAGCDNEAEASSRILWFKNWVSLQSVRGIDHIHVLVKDASDAQLHEWTSNNAVDC